jgi:glycosyltransferase involved in cell wall biosynthesis
MKISIITPTHNTRFLGDLEDSVMAQIHKDWEWVILLNNGARWIPKKSDDRIRIVVCPFDGDSVGALKKYACSLACGEVIAEVDHDDMITADCLAEVAAAFADEEIGFVYSDNAKLQMEGVFLPYMAEYGWTYRRYNWKGRSLIAMNSLPMTPNNIGNIWFAPDHVRAWRKSVYDLIGGHDEKLAVCDDLDLMHRLYLVTRFKFISKVLYIYRIVGDNTWMKKGEEIERENKRLYEKDIEMIKKRYAELNSINI